MIVGTAGHIDHGKTSLVRALTGVDTDRLKEEKARGISIDLGFAYLPSLEDSILGFVDVPGVSKEKETFNGWTIGAGVDYSFTDNVFGRAEYRYNDYGDKDIGGVNVDLDQHQFTVGVGVKF